MPKKATAYTFGLGLPSQANQALMQVNPTLASGDVKISNDGGAFANLTNLPAVTPAGGKRVEVVLTSTEMNADNITVVFSDAAGAEWSDVMVGIQTTDITIDEVAGAVWDEALAGHSTAGSAGKKLNDTAAEVDLALDATSYDGFSFIQIVRLMASVLFGKGSGLATATAIYRAADDTKARVTATVDADGNRTALTLDPN